MIRPDHIELRQLDLSLVDGVVTAAGTHRERPLLVARVTADGGEGWGECGALPAGTAVDPALERVRPVAEALAEALVAAAVAEEPDPALPSGYARSMFEMALLDAELRIEGRSLARHLGATRERVDVGAMVGIPPDRVVGTLIDRAEAVLDPSRGGARRLRVKIAPGWDREPVAALRDRFPDVALQADANGAYRAISDGARGLEALRSLEPFSLICLEQPLPPDDLAGHAWLAGRLGVPIALDESLSSLERVTEALQLGAMAVACLKPARLGGLEAASEARNRCRDAGVPVFVGGLFESGLGRSANLAVAALDGCHLPGDLTSPVGYLSDQPFSYPEVRNGAVAVPDGPGIGVRAEPEVIERLTVWERSFVRRAT